MACEQNGANCIAFARRAYNKCCNEKCQRRPLLGVHRQSQLCPVCFHEHLEKRSSDKTSDVWPPCRCTEHRRIVNETQLQYNGGPDEEQQYHDEHGPTSIRAAMIEDAPTFECPERQPRTQLAPPPGMFVGAQAAQAQSAEEPQQPLPPAPAPQIRVKVPPPTMPPKPTGGSSSGSRDPMEAASIQGIQARIAVLEAKIDTLTDMLQLVISKNNWDGKW